MLRPYITYQPKHTGTVLQRGLWVKLTHHTSFERGSVVSLKASFLTNPPEDGTKNVKRKTKNEKRKTKNEQQQKIWGKKQTTFEQLINVEKRSSKCAITGDYV